MSAHKNFCDFSCFINEIGSWYRANTISFRSILISETNGIRDRKTFNKLVKITGWLAILRLNTQTHNFQAFRMISRIELHKTGYFHSAWPAPCSPEIKHNHLAFEFGQVQIG